VDEVQKWGGRGGLFRFLPQPLLLSHSPLPAPVRLLTKALGKRNIVKKAFEITIAIIIIIITIAIIMTIAIYTHQHHRHHRHRHHHHILAFGHWGRGGGGVCDRVLEDVHQEQGGIGGG